MLFEDENGRRPGDWTHRAARERANEERREKAEKEARANGRKWYDDPFWIIVLLLIFWPVGIVLLWRSKWSTTVKVLITILLAVYIVVAFNISLSIQAYMAG